MGLKLGICSVYSVAWLLVLHKIVRNPRKGTVEGTSVFVGFQLSLADCT